MRRAAVISILGLGLASAGAEAAPTTDNAGRAPRGSHLEARGSRREERVGPGAGRGVTARFSQGQVSGSSACNQYQGTYTVEGTSSPWGLSWER